MKSLPLLFKSFSAIFIVSFLLLFSSFQTEKTVWLSSLDLSKMSQGSDNPVADKNKDKSSLSIAKQSFEKGVGTRTRSYVWIDLDDGSDRFIAYTGVDDDTAKIGNTKLAYNTTHNFEIFGDGKKLWQSGPMNYGDAAKKADIDVKGIKTLILTVVNSGKGGNHVQLDLANAKPGVVNDSYVQLDWAGAYFIVNGNNPKTIFPPTEEAVILTPKPLPAPRINGPKVYGCRPGNPFLYRIPTTGKRPMQFSAKNLPAGLRLNTTTGIITGRIAKRGVYSVIVNAKNSQGKDSRLFKIKCGDMLALTPPMGWNDWYAYYLRVTDKKIRNAADILVSSGMADAGYQYVNIDDGWGNQEIMSGFWKAADSAGITDKAHVGPGRDKQGNILANSYFPDMAGLTKYIHSKGLKAGIYTSPGPTTCVGYTGAYQHEEQDARQFARWGFDFLKYDWCSYGPVPGYIPNGAVPGVDLTLDAFQKPYRKMGNILKTVHRDIVYNLCQYGMFDVWKWGAEVGANSWRTGGDLGGELNLLFDVALKNASYGAYCKPGAWNDPDYIQIGYIGNLDGSIKPCGFTPNEQYSFMSMWCLMAAPLFYSGALNKLDDFTLNVLCNPEVIAVNQDPLGKCGKIVQKNDDSFIIVKDMEDGSKAVDMCNTGEVPAAITLKWTDVGIRGKQTVRDLWREKDWAFLLMNLQLLFPGMVRR